jgi:hypothetical protein
MADTQTARPVSARRITASAIGVGVIGLGGLDHGIFEILQGSVTPSGLIIDAIGPTQRFWAGSSEPAFTLIPNMLVTGICAVIVSLLVMVWAGFFIDRRYGALVLLLLSTLLFLVGGGGGPIIIAVIACIPASQINKPMAGRRRRVPPGAQSLLARLWPWSLVAGMLLFYFAMEMAIFGWPFAGFLSTEATTTILMTAGNLSTLLLLLAAIAALAYDSQRR